MSCLSRKLCLNYPPLKHYCLIKSLGASHLFSCEKLHGDCQYQGLDKSTGLQSNLSVGFSETKLMRALFSLTTEQIQTHFIFTCVYSHFFLFSSRLFRLDYYFLYLFGGLYWGKNQYYCFLYFNVFQNPNIKLIYATDMTP